MKFFLFKIFIFFTSFQLFSVTTEVIQALTLKINPISELTITSGNAPLYISDNQALPGNPVMISDPLSSNTYSYTALGLIPKKITGRIDAKLPAGVTLEATLEAPNGAHSFSSITLNNTQDQDLVKSIPPNSKGNNLLITYQLKSTVKAGPIQNLPIQVTLKLVDDLP